MTRHLPVLTTRSPFDPPKTRGDCANIPRPCPFTRCRHNLYSEHRDVELEDVPPARSCALDIADGGESTLEDIAQVFGLTRERVRQIEAKALKQIRERKMGRVLAELAPEGRTVDARRSHTPSRDADAPAGGNVPQEREYRRPEDDYTAGLNISFFDEGEDADQRVTDAVWRMFAKDSTARGFDARSESSKRSTKWRRANPTKGMRPFVEVQVAQAKRRAG